MSFWGRLTGKKDYDLNGNRFYQEYIVNSADGDGADALKLSPSLAAGLRIAEGIAAMPVVYGEVSYDAQGRAVKVPRPLGRPSAAIPFDRTVAYRLMHEPNDYMTPIEFFETMALHAVFEGVARAYIQRGYKGHVRRIIPLTDGGVTSAKDPATGRVYYNCTVPGIGFMEGLTRRDFIEVTNPRWNDIEGLNITSKLKEVLGLALSLQSRQKSDAAKKQVSGFFSFTEAIGSDAAAQVQKAMAEKMPGTPILDSGAQYKQLLPTASEMQLLESRRFVIEEVARAFGIHPLLLAHDGAGQSLTRVADVMDYHVTMTLAPWVRRFEAAIRFSCLEPDEYIDLDERRYYRMSLADQASFAAKSLGEGGGQAFSTVNEAREALGYNPIQGGDQIGAAGDREIGDADGN